MVNEDQIKRLLFEVKQGRIEIDDALNKLRAAPFVSLGGFAKLDTHRALRCGFPEVVFGLGKTAEHLVQIINELATLDSSVMVTKLSQSIYDEIRAQIPKAEYHAASQVLIIRKQSEATPLPGVIVLTAGTVDIPVAEEAALTAELMGNQVKRLYDVGVAGLHRLLSQLEQIQRAKVIVAVAGMEGALVSVVAGLVASPVIAVPTSAGYGASFGGVAALLTMLNSCAAGVSVVNIDNGFGAGSIAGRINQLQRIELS